MGYSISIVIPYLLLLVAIVGGAVTDILIHLFWIMTHDDNYI